MFERDAFSDFKNTIESKILFLNFIRLYNNISFLTLQLQLIFTEVNSNKIRPILTKPTFNPARKPTCRNVIIFTLTAQLSLGKIIAKFRYRILKAILKMKTKELHFKLHDIISWRQISNKEIIKRKI